MADKNFTVERERTIAAPADRISELITDFHEWKRWSPWEDVDPQLHRAYSGPESGPGARYAWSGNRKAGAGSMEITHVDDGRVDVDLEFLKPFASQNTIEFLLAPAGSGTRVTWRMTGTRPFLMRLLGPVISMDKLVGKDFEKGLTKLDRAATT